MDNVARPLGYAFEVRHRQTDVLIGTGLVVPSVQHVRYRAAVSTRVEEPALSPEVWVTIAEWAAAGDGALPSRPAPLPSAAVAAIINQDDVSALIAERFAAGPATLDRPVP